VHADLDPRDARDRERPASSLSPVVVAAHAPNVRSHGGAHQSRRSCRCHSCGTSPSQPSRGPIRNHGSVSREPGSTANGYTAIAAIRKHGSRDGPSGWLSTEEAYPPRGWYQGRDDGPDGCSSGVHEGVDLPVRRVQSPGPGRGTFVSIGRTQRDAMLDRRSDRKDLP
jgi:hypothetical protein